MLLGLGVALDGSGRVGRLAASLGVLVLLAGFAVANSVLRSPALRRLGQARSVACGRGDGVGSMTTLAWMSEDTTS